ncbi:MAG TPA: hypothetical protein VD866_06360 [Urbifossiella sp.]|nr:hypothetical protein [Urbifossiella sp.]
MELPHITRADAYARQFRTQRADMLTPADMGVLQVCWEEIRILIQKVAVLEAEVAALKTLRHRLENRETYGHVG